jgi:hypothetical protein
MMGTMGTGLAQDTGAAGRMSHACKNVLVATRPRD